MAFAELVFWEIPSDIQTELILNWLKWANAFWILSELSTSQSRSSLLQCLENIYLFFCFREMLNKLTEAVGHEISDPTSLSGAFSLLATLKYHINFGDLEKWYQEQSCLACVNVCWKRSQKPGFPLLATYYWYIVQVCIIWDHIPCLEKTLLRLTGDLCLSWSCCGVFFGCICRSKLSHPCYPVDTLDLPFLPVCVSTYSLIGDSSET